MSEAATPAPWSVSEARTVEGEYMVVGGEGQGFGLISSCPEKADAELIVRLRNQSGVLNEDAAARKIERLLNLVTRPAPSVTSRECK